MKRNVTLCLPDDLVRKAKVHAAERDTSLSALVGELLGQVIGTESYEQIWAEEEAVMAKGPLRVGSVEWSRDELHQR